MSAVAGSVDDASGIIVLESRLLVNVAAAYTYVVAWYVKGFERIYSEKVLLGNTDVCTRR